jgi:hypothetical protein
MGSRGMAALVLKLVAGWRSVVDIQALAAFPLGKKKFKKIA